MPADIVLLIPHYNDLAGLGRSLASISAAEPVDVLIVDDGSRERPDPVELQKKYPQIASISCLMLERNRGIDRALNSGLEHILREDRHRYIARLDQGDLCHPDRFSIQRSFLDSHEDVALVGSWVSYVDMDGREMYTGRFPEDHDSIRRGMFVNSMFCHPAVMFRTDAVRALGMYDTDFPLAEDYAYFFRFVKKFKTANIGRPLVTYELHTEGVSRKRHRRQVISKMRVLLRNWEWRPLALWALFRNVLLCAAPVQLLTAIKKKVYR